MVNGKGKTNVCVELKLFSQVEVNNFNIFEYKFDKNSLDYGCWVML